jgi:adenylate cyclase
LVMVPAYLVPSFLILAFEESGHYVEAAAVTGVAVLVLVYVLILPGRGGIRLVERWAVGHEVDREKTLHATYTWAPEAVARMVVEIAIWAALLFVVVGVIAGATGLRLVQYGILGAVAGPAILLIGVHSFVEAALRPARIALVGDTGIGEESHSPKTYFAQLLPSLAQNFMDRPDRLDRPTAQ